MHSDNYRSKRVSDAVHWHIRDVLKLIQWLKLAKFDIYRFEIVSDI